MCACGGSRRWPAANGAAPPALPARADAVVLRYLGQVALLVKGAVSGRVYALRPAARIECDARDVAAFLGSALFERLSS